MKIGNTSFNVEAVKALTLKQFKDTYVKILPSANLEEMYEKVTGKQVKTDKNADLGSAK